jgi:VanZ family protein
MRDGEPSMVARLKPDCGGKSSERIGMQAASMFRATLRLAAWGLLCLIGFFTLCPIQYRPKLTEDPQIERALAYFLLGLLLAAAYPRSRLLAGLGLLLAAAGLELSQRFVPGRDAALRDLLAKGVGGVAGVAACWGVDNLVVAVKVGHGSASIDGEVLATRGAAPSSGER